MGLRRDSSEYMTVRGMLRCNRVTVLCMFVFSCTDHSEIASSPRRRIVKSANDATESPNNSLIITIETHAPRLNQASTCPPRPHYTERRIFVLQAQNLTPAHHNTPPSTDSNPPPRKPNNLTLLPSSTTTIATAISDIPHWHKVKSAKTMASETPEHHLSASQNDHDHEHARLLHGDETLSPLEQEVLDEYARLLGNLNTVRLHYVSCVCVCLVLQVCASLEMRPYTFAPQMPNSPLVAIR